MLLVQNFLCFIEILVLIIKKVVVIRYDPCAIEILVHYLWIFFEGLIVIETSTFHNSHWLHLKFEDARRVTNGSFIIISLGWVMDIIDIS